MASIRDWSVWFRYGLMAVAVAVVAVLWFTRDTDDTNAAALDPRPNILVIVTDDQPEGTLSVMPVTRKWFGREGRTFKRAMDSTPLCCPVRASILTGRYPHNHKVQTMYDAEQIDQETTLQYYLGSAGYRTGLAGKFLNRWALSKPPRYLDEWAYWSKDGGYYDTMWNVGSKATGGGVKQIGQYNTHFISDRAIGFIRRSEQTDTQPWFLYLAPYAPHDPFPPEPKYQGAPVPEWKPNPAVLESNRRDKPPYVREKSVARRLAKKTRKKQLRTLMSVDDMVARIRDQLRALDEERDTIAVFVSDNGYMWGDHGLMRKRAPYRTSVQVPLLMRWPGHISSSSKDRRLVTSVDIAPTLLAAAGMSPEAEKPMDGKSLLDRSWDRKRVLLEYYKSAEIPNVPTWAATITKKLQYIEYYRDSGKRSFTELYFSASDFWQNVNVLRNPSTADDPNRKRLKRLHERLARDRRCAGSTCS